MGLPIGQKLVKSGSTWARLCGTHIFGTAGWIYTIRSSMELSRPVVVQHQGHLTLTLDFQGQILKMLFLAATKQLYEWFSPSVRLSVCHTFLTMFLSTYHHEIFRIYYQWQKWRPCKRSRSKVKVTEVTTQLNRFRTVTPVWIHIWWWNDAYSLMILRRGALLFLKVIHRISRSHGSKKRRIWPRLGVSGL